MLCLQGTDARASFYLLSVVIDFLYSVYFLFYCVIFLSTFRRGWCHRAGSFDPAALPPRTEAVQLCLFNYV